MIDPEKADAASRMQARSPWWLVMWSPYRRMFTAFACFAPGAIVLDQPDAVALASEMARQELKYPPMAQALIMEVRA